jgi:predicted enzyme related to lactoylglutathione lyase
MHKSRLGAIVIDCETDDLDREAVFWSGAFGGAPRRSPDPGDTNYLELKTPPGEVVMLLQKVDHPSRLHLDIETDDIEAEAERLEKLGAKRLAFIKNWQVMEAPSGHRFCIVRAQRAGFESEANEWA